MITCMVYKYGIILYAWVWVRVLGALWCINTVLFF